jgi:arylsulfatase A-like enzyme
MGSPPESTPLKYGFMSSYGYFAGQIDPYTHRYKTGEETWHRNDRLIQEAGHATDLITDEAVRVIQAGHTQPFFLYVAYSVPHYPLREPDSWLAAYPGIEEESRRWFAASVTHMDSGIGRIVAAIDGAGLRENTLMVFISDNGGQESWHSETQYRGSYADKPHRVLGNNFPLKGWKTELYEGGIRVPLAIAWKGEIGPGQSSNDPVSHIDLFPTLLDAAGIEDREADPTIPLPDGINLLPYILNNKSLPERPLFWHFPVYLQAYDPENDETRDPLFRTRPGSVIRLGDWKLHQYFEDSGLELYNLREDTAERINLHTARPEKSDELLRILEEWRRETMAPVTTEPNPEYSPSS